MPSCRERNRLHELIAGNREAIHITAAGWRTMLGNNITQWGRWLNKKAARWRSGRLRQLGKSSQPIEPKWAV
jgi:hypothetical protein